jgi:exonuclease III|tara:strand:+ start:9608 stop:9766 length:159 start_codon:yes stop_codon:yes gene_type:complete
MLQEIKDLKVTDVIGGTLITLFALGWIDTLWMFGVENSQQYTWWNLIYLMGQ